MAERKPKKDDRKDEDARMLAALGFAFILIVIGIPLWWKTTKVHRVPLPYDRIGELSDVYLTHEVNVMVVTGNEYRSQKIVRDLQEAFKSSRIFSFSFHGRSLSSRERAVLGEGRKLHELDTHSELPHPNERGHILFLEVPAMARLTEAAVVVGSRRTIYFASDSNYVRLVAVLQDWILQESSMKLTIDAMEAPTRVGRDLWGRRRIVPSIAYDILVSLVIPDPQAVLIDWDVKKAISDYMMPFLSQMSVLADFNVKSQVLYFVSLGARHKNIDYFPYHDEESLPHIITPLEKKIASHVSRHPTLNLVVYVAPCGETPVHLFSKYENLLVLTSAFISPQWGGVQIVNTSEECSARQSGSPEGRNNSDSKGSIYDILLKKDSTLVSLNSAKEPLPQTELLPLKRPEPREWELDLLMRVRTMEQITSAKLTLQSLSQLLATIGNIVIEDEVGESVWNATEGVEKATKLLAAGDLFGAFTLSQNAFVSAERAFTDRSLLALLYFPDDQKLMLDWEEYVESID
ncbi:hypothetical protein J437_LFUL018351 [Ladona fulva]|uniref:GPI transamidase component PIG-S n=1 Tax=Ladona fulva TaxID=123851 RepID=A0A8K0P9X7_LADFU|nr:hypothetical protein J437_LFUL018351 [Ladona fulva]